MNFARQPACCRAMPPLRTNLAVTYQKLGETPEALNVFESAVRANPANPPLHLGLGITLLQAGGSKRRFLN